MMFLAAYRLDDRAVCVMTRFSRRGGKAGREYHDYHDSTTPEPWHFIPHTCARCGAEFTI